MLQLTWRQAAAWRAGRQYLVQRAPAGSMLTVASRLCGLHAQVMSSAELTLWARVEGLDRQDVRRALWEDRTLVKSWAMRGTLHLLPARELPLWHAALGTSDRYLGPEQWKKYFGVTMEELDRITEAVATALAGRILTREELAQEVGRLTGSAAFGANIAESSWGTMLRPAAFAGRLCFGPSQGSRVTFTCPETWLGAASSKVDPQQALATITKRFLAAFGPATYQDLARWWGARSGIAKAREWIALLGNEVSVVKLGRDEAWMLAEDARAMADFSAHQSVRLLPGFDQYTVAASPHAEHLLPGNFRSRIYRPQGWISPVLLVNGRMEGVWRYTAKGTLLELEVEPFVKAPLWVRQAVRLEAERLADFLDCGLSLKWRT